MVSEVKCFCDFNLEFCLASSSNTSQKHQNKGKIMFQFYSIEVNREYVVDSELVSDFGYHWCFLKEKGFLKPLGNEYYAQKDKRKCPVSTQMLPVWGSLACSLSPSALGSYFRQERTDHTFLPVLDILGVCRGHQHGCYKYLLI